MAHANTNVLADHLTPARSTLLDLSWVLGFSLLTAIMAQIRFQFPFTPVPLTGQTFAVLLSGAVLGSRRAFASQACYLLAGSMGFPVFAGGSSTFAHLLGPTGGYLWSYPVAAAMMGWLVERGAGRKVWSVALSLVFCDALILISGAAWLHTIFGYPYAQAFLLGFYPFLLGDILKIVLVGLTLPRFLNRSGQTIQT